MRNFYSVGILAILVMSLPLTAARSQNGTGSTGAEGSSGAKVVMTEYSDYQCPACGYFHPIVKKLKQEYGDDLKVNYRYYPLNSHQFAALAARAAEAARNQGKFLEMHNRIFDNQQYWASTGNPQPIFIGYADDLGLDLEQFRDDLNSGETQRAVMEQKQEGRAKGVNSTPTFFINGEKLPTLPRTYQDFKAILDSYMQETN